MMHNKYYMECTDPTEDILMDVISGVFIVIALLALFVLGSVFFGPWV